MKVTIIIPLYNLEGYIGKCIRSTFDQHLSADEYEVIVVNDGSTDGSYAAACRAAEGHSNVHILTKANEGLSKARNYGTDRAKGKYIVYLDADDYLEPNKLGEIVRIMERDSLDMLCIRLRAVDEQGTELPYWSDRIFSRYGPHMKCGFDFLQDPCLIPMVCAYIYNREFLDIHDLRMRFTWHEDEEFTPRALYHARRTSYFSDPFYNYFQRKTSFTGDYKPEKIFHMVPVLQSLSLFAGQIEKQGDAQGARLMRQHIGVTSFLLCKRSVRRRYGNARELIRRLRNAGIFPLVFPQRKFHYMLLNSSTTLFILYYRLHKKQR